MAKKKTEKNNLKKGVRFGENRRPSVCVSIFERLYGNILTRVKYLAPRFWRKHWGYPIPMGKRYEDFCENLKPTTLAKDVLGRAGERLIFERILHEPGCKAIACNTENYYCEIDVVFLDEKTKEIVFVEVKTRRYDSSAFRPEDFAIDRKRKKKLALAGRAFMHERGYVEYTDRYDVAVVIMPEIGEPTIRYYKGFFTYLSAVKEYRGVDFGKTRSLKYLREDLRARRQNHK